VADLNVKAFFGSKKQTPKTYVKIFQCPAYF